MSEKNQKRVEAARARWEDLSVTEEVELKQSIAKGMRDYWSRMTPEQRSEIGRKAAATRRANREAKRKGLDSEDV